MWRVAGFLGHRLLDDEVPSKVLNHLVGAASSPTVPYTPKAVIFSLPRSSIRELGVSRPIRLEATSLA